MKKLVISTAAVAALAALAGTAQAADWSDTSIGYRYGTKFAEPYGTNDITKNILSLTHVSGFKYGSNFFNVDMLMSNKKDPASFDQVSGTTTGSAQETYIVYRNTLDFEKMSGTSFKSTGIRGYGLTWGFDWNTKDDAGYNSKKRMLVLGPTVNFDVPGFLSASVLLLKESNAPYSDFSGIATPRYTYKTHPMLTAAWGIPLGSGFSFEGFVNFIASKGKDEFGAQTKPETDLDMQVMYDITGKNTFKVGLEYQYWKNKFGNDANGPAGPGATAKTPMVRAEYHF